MLGDQTVRPFQSIDFFHPSSRFPINRIRLEKGKEDALVFFMDGFKAETPGLKSLSSNGSLGGEWEGGVLFK